MVDWRTPRTAGHGEDFGPGDCLGLLNTDTQFSWTEPSFEEQWLCVLSLRYVAEERLNAL